MPETGDFLAVKTSSEDLGKIDHFRPIGVTLNNQSLRIERCFLSNPLGFLKSFPNNCVGYVIKDNTQHHCVDSHRRDSHSHRCVFMVEAQNWAEERCLRCSCVCIGHQ